MTADVESLRRWVDSKYNPSQPIPDGNTNGTKTESGTAVQWDFAHNRIRVPGSGRGWIHVDGLASLSPEQQQSLQSQYSSVQTGGGRLTAALGEISSTVAGLRSGKAVTPEATEATATATKTNAAETQQTATTTTGTEPGFNPSAYLKMPNQYDVLAGAGIKGDMNDVLAERYTPSDFEKDFGVSIKGLLSKGAPQATPYSVGDFAAEWGKNPADALNQATVGDFRNWAGAPSEWTPWSATNGMTTEELMSDPSYQFRRDQAILSANRSAAAHGNALSGGAAKELEQYASDLASTEYAAAWQRHYTEGQSQLSLLQTYLQNDQNSRQMVLNQYNSSAEQNNAVRLGNLSAENSWQDNVFDLFNNQQTNQLTRRGQDINLYTTLSNQYQQAQANSIDYYLGMLGIDQTNRAMIIDLYTTLAGIYGDNQERIWSELSSLLGTGLSATNSNTSTIAGVLGQISQNQTNYGENMATNIWGGSSAQAAASNNQTSVLGQALSGQAAATGTLGGVLASDGVRQNLNTLWGNETSTTPTSGDTLGALL